ncbi:hypothetical protein Pst134EA_032369 [Puccinia striiformis f. sp. tritici]|uniref:uncharacterized protein n=1 Tax=Puccinia striiformis f. sp. tritici TaxID=168172 RepID=UPI0020082091|nr:uncharacterized protein Pst134EA_032369 [Puccinia striiformis f. sp. tritici]KAH9441764.1 hypothetical protein Pst134EA_032369 [Puccinia striiformis f. sp. tritici]
MISQRPSPHLRLCRINDQSWHKAQDQTVQYQRQQGNVAISPPRSTKAQDELKILPGEGLGSFNHRVEATLRPQTNRSN